MVIPLPDLGDLAAQRPHIGIHQVVAVAATELVERFGHFRDFGCDDVLPHRAIAQLDFSGDGTIGIDGVAAVQKHIGVDLAHLFIDAHATKGFVDTKALACGVPAPDQTEWAGGCARGRQRGAEMPLHGGRAHIGAGKVFQHHAVEDVLTGWQALQVNAACAVAAAEQIRAAQLGTLRKAGGGAPFQPHAGIAAGAGPDDGAVGQHITALHAGGQQGAGAVAGHGGRGCLGAQHGGQQACAGDEGAGAQSVT